MLKHFDENLRKYAELIVKVGVNVDQSQTVVVQIEVEQAALARLIVEEAYKQGADEVIVKWVDDFVTRQMIEHASEECLKTLPEHVVDETEDWIEKGASRIAVVSSNPDAFAGLDAKRIALYQETYNKGMAAIRKVSQANKISWTVVAAAGKGWAAKVFPELSTSEEQIEALWDQIFKTTRIYSQDPVAAWKEHDAWLAGKAARLNQEQFDALHYTAPGTDLMVGLPKNHIWKGAGSINARGEKFMANMPTEEVFTAPDCHRVEGTVVSTKPLSYAGTVITGMKFTFKEGEVIDFSAEQGEEVLRTLLETDKGAKHLGEVALVPDSSPISQSNLIFYNTLFDENASNHFALGSAYAFNIENGTKMDEKELIEAGLNRSLVHVDFMVGSNQMNVDGLRKDGTRVPIFRNGEWVNG